MSNVVTQWDTALSGLWTVAGNWSDGVPTSSLDAVLPNTSYTVTLTGAGAANSLTVSGTNVALLLYTNSNTPATSLTVQGQVTNDGYIYVDEYYGTGGTSISIGGTLTNATYLDIGYYALTADSTVTANNFVNTGSVVLAGGTGTYTGEATLDITGSAAPSTLTGSYSLSGNALVEFATGTISAIGTNASLSLSGPDAFFADAGNPDSNSALSGLSSNAGMLELNQGADVQILGNLTNSDFIEVDYYYASSVGSTLTIGGTLNNTASLYIGNSTETTGSTVTAATLANTGTIYLFGGTGANTGQTTLDITGGSAPAVLSGTLNLSGNALVEFASGSYTSIAAGSALYLNGGSAFIADANDPTANGALSGLVNNAGTFELFSAAPVDLTGNFTNTGTVFVDTNYAGGSVLSIGGTLANTGTLYIGNGGAVSGTSIVSAAALTAGGSIRLAGGTGSSTYEAILEVAAAPSVVSGTIVVTGDAEMEFGSGGITNVLGGGEIELVGATALIADAASPGTNSGLAGLANNAGTIDLELGATVTIGGDFTNAATLDMDVNSTDGGSTLTVDGALTNRGYFLLGNLYQTSGSSTVNVGALANTGTVTLEGGTTTGNYQVTFDVTAGPAPSILTGTLNLYSHALLEFTIGQIGAIATGATITIDGANAWIADAGSPNSNSALTGLASNAGTFALDGGAAISITADFANFGTTRLNAQSYGSGSTMLSVGGTLTNAGTLTIGSTGEIAPVTVSTEFFANNGTLYLTGGTGSDTNQSTLDVTSGAAPAVLQGNYYISGHAVLEFASGSISAIAQNAGLLISGGTAFVADAANTAANSALSALTTNAGNLNLQGLVSVTLGNFVNLGTTSVDTYVTEGGSTLIVGGTLSNTNYLSIGNTSLTAPTTVSAGSLTNAGTIYLEGGTGTDTNAATLVVGGGMVDTGIVYLLGHAGISAGSVTIANGGTVSVGSGASLSGANIATAGSVIVSSGGTSIAPTIAGGSLDLTSGSIASGGVTFAGAGTLEIDGGTISAPTISGFAVGDTIDLRPLAWSAGNSASFNGTTLSVTSGGATDTLTLVGVTSGTQFTVASDGHGGTAVTELPAATTFWNIASGGSWTNSAGWQGGLPSFGTAATIGVAGGYTVSLTANGVANSLTLNQGSVTLSLITSSGGTADLVVQGDVVNSGNVLVDTTNGLGGSVLSVGGTLSNTDLTQIGTGGTTNGSTLTAGAIVNTYAFYIEGATKSGQSVTVAANVTNTGTFYIDASYGNGGSIASVGGTFANTGTLQIGNTALAAGVTLDTAFLSSTGSIYLYGGTGSDTNVATLDVTSGSAPAILTGTVNLSGRSVLEFAGGSVTGIANGATLVLTGANAFVADANAPNVNGALSGLGTIDGRLDLESGPQVQISGDLAVYGTLDVDTSYGGAGGTTLTLGGTLTNTNTVMIGSEAQTLPSTLDVGSLTNTGTIYLYGGTTSGTSTATLDVTGAAAPAVFTGNAYLYGQSELEYAGGSIGTIANNSTILLAGSSAFIADAAAPGSNSALDGMTGNAGSLQLAYGANVQILGDLLNNGTISVDYYYGTTGGSTLAVGGTLTNAGYMYIGDDISTNAPSTIVSADQLVDTGSITIYGGVGSSTAQGILNVSGSAAPAALTGNLTLYGNALVEFDGGSIGAIAAGGSVVLAAANAHIADAGATGSNSALTGLTSNAGSLQLGGGATVNLQGSFTNTGSVFVDYYYYTSIGGSTLTVNGTLTNSGSLYMGYGGTVASTVSTAFLANTGTVYLYGGTGSNAAQVLLTVTGSAAPTVVTGNFDIYNDAAVEFAGSASASGIAANSQISLSGANAFFETASATGSNSALARLSSNAGTLELADGATLAIQGDLSNTGLLSVDYYNAGAIDSSLSIAGTLNNAGSLYIGNSYTGLPGTTVTVAGLNNTGTIVLTGGTGAASYLATLDVASQAAPAVLAGTLSLSGNTLVEFTGGSISGIGQTGQINLYSGNAFIADAGATGSNSALTGLSSNAGILTLNSGVTLTTNGNFSNTGSLDVDSNYYNPVASTLTFGGVLNNTGYISIGYYGDQAGSTVSATGLNNTGYLYLEGSVTSGIAASTLNIAGAGTDGGYIVVEGSATLSAGSLSVISGGSVTVLSGGSVSGVVVGSGGIEYVSSGGVAASGTIAGGTLDLAGGSVTAADIAFTGSGGVLRLDTTTMPTNTILGFGSAQTIDLRVVSGGSAGSGSINTANNVLTVTENGTPYSLHLDPNRNYTNATVVLTSDGSGGTDVTLNIPPTVISAGMSMTISAGETEDNITILSGGLLIVLSGGTATDTTDEGTEILSGGTDIDGTIAAGGTMLVSSGGNAADTTVSSLGGMTVMSGGSATTATITGGGFIAVQSGGVTISSMIAGSGSNPGGTGTVESAEFVVGGTALATMVSAGGDLLVSAGGVESGGTVGASGFEAVFTGGTATATTITGGGELDVSAGGAAVGVTLLGGLLQDNGGSVTGTIVDAQGLQLVNSGAATGTIVNTGGEEIVLAGATANGTILSGGIQLVQGSATGTLVDSGSTLALASGGVANGLTLNPGATLAIVDGYVLSGYVVSAGYAFEVGGGAGAGLPAATASALATTVSSGGVMIVASGGVASGTVVSAGGTELVLSGGLDTGASVTGAGAAETVNAGGVTVGTALGTGSTETVNLGGVASNTTIAGGSLILNAGGSATGTTGFVGSGGSLQISGTTMPTTPIVDFAQSDSIDLPSVAATGISYQGGVVTLISGTTTVAQLTVATPYTNPSFQEVRDASGGATITDAPPPSANYSFITGFTKSNLVQTGLIKEFPSGVVTGNEGLTTPFDVVSDADGNNFDEITGTLTINVSLQDVTNVYTLMNAYGPPAGVNGATVKFVGNLGATQTFTLVYGSDLRDFYQGVFANTINGTTTQNAFTVSGVTDAGGAGSVNNGLFGTYVVDEQDFVLNSAFASQTLQQIVITNLGSGGTPILLGVTAQTIPGGSGGSVISAGQTLVVSAGETLSGVVVLSGGTLEVVSGGTVVDAQIGAGATEIIGLGGVDISATVASGGNQEIFGTTSGTLIVAGGTQTVETGGTALGTVLDDAALQTVLGFAGGTVISAGDTELVVAGGVASGTVISSSGAELVAAGGLTSNTTIAGGGRLELEGGALATGNIVFSGTGGILQINGTNAPTTPISGFVRNDLLDLHDLAFNTANTASFNATTGVLTVSGAGSEVLTLSGVASGTVFGVSNDGTGGTLVKEVPPAPAGLALAAASDSGVQGDNITNVTIPVIAGSGEAGDTVTLFDGTVAVGGGTVTSAGSWAVTTNVLAAGTHSLTARETDATGNASAASSVLTLSIDTAPPLVTAASLTVATGSGATPIGITAPSDSNFAAGTLSVTVQSLPSNGNVTLSDGTTAVTKGESLTVAQLTGLDFTPNAGQTGTTGSFAYTVVDPAGNSATGNASLAVAASSATNLFDFEFTYADGKDYYYGSVADNGTYGYATGETINSTAGQYTIYNEEGLPTSEPAGTVVVLDYSHGGAGQASTTPVKTAAGTPDGSQGLGSESDAVLGTDGTAHAFSSTSEASFATTALYGFVYTYADGTYYTGTVADSGNFGLTGPGSVLVSNSAGQTIGSYQVFADGVTIRASGSVVIDRFVSGGMSFSPNATASGVNGTAGIRSESGSVTVNGINYAFSDSVEPTPPVNIGTLPPTTTPTNANVITGELDAVYAQVLRRIPDTSGLVTYTADLNNGTPLATIRTILAQSTEAQNDINALYQQILNRNADSGGFATYTSDLINGTSLDGVQLILAQSSEAQNDLGALYEQVLNRAADGGGLVTYEGDLATGTSLDTVQTLLAQSSEAQNDLTSLFEGVIGRAPGTAELVGMENQLAAGTTQSGVLAALSAQGTGGAGETIVTAATGSTSLTAAPSTPTQFTFGNIAFGNDTIAGFDTTRDTIQLPKALVANYTALQSETTSTAAGSTLITLNATQSITLTNLTKSSLSSGNFVFV
jgi:autotransporter passenger strand-loop-strand repeat protein